MARNDALRDQVVLVTGAAGGIGTAAACLLARHGARLVLADVDGAALARVQLPAGSVALRAELDVSSPASWTRVLREVLERHGRIDGLVNVAGVVEPGRADALPVEQLERQVAVNLVGTMLGCRAVIPLMRARRMGAIVNVASLGGIVPMPGEAVYCATKHGVRGYSFSLRAELHHSGVDVSVVCPDSVQTAQLEHELDSGEAPLSFLGHAMSPDVVAAAILHALRRRNPEVLVPAVMGLIARMVMAFPGLALRLLPWIERRGRANMEKQRAAFRRAAGLDAIPCEAAARRLRLVGGLQVVLAIGIAAFWAVFFALGPGAIADPAGERVYLAFETAFPVADGCLALTLALAGSGLLRGRRHGPPLSLAAGGALVFLGLLDASFNAVQGIYQAGPTRAVVNGLVNLACIGGGVAVIAGVTAVEERTPSPACTPPHSDPLPRRGRGDLSRTRSCSNQAPTTAPDDPTQVDGSRRS